MEVLTNLKGSVMKNCNVLILISMILLALAGAAHAGETLYNGIELPDEWPPDYGPLTREPMPVPYLENRPAVIAHLPPARDLQGTGDQTGGKEGWNVRRALQWGGMLRPGR